ASAHILQFFSTLARENQARAPKKSQAKKIAERLLSQEGYSAAKSDFASLKAAIDRLMDEHSHRTTRAHWETLKRQLAARAKTKRGGGPEKSVQFPGGYCLSLRGDRLFWIRNTAR
ncbi:MAG: hypothetical protein HY216_06670, partial [Candidatus Rokubacteria bacterium]|nr:hypothetical protein [Candidatus Rokubacteria bacterium]